MRQWFAANWLWVVVVGLPLLVITVLNKATKVWFEHTGFKKWAQFIVSMLSPLPSLGRGWLKLPLIPELPWYGDRKDKKEDAGSSETGFVLTRVCGLLILATLMWVFAVLATGCADTSLGKLGQLQTSVGGLRQSATVVLDSRCAALVPACPYGGLGKCDSYQKCISIRKIIYASASGLQVTIDAAASLVHLGKLDEARRLLPTITEGLNRLVQQLVYYDVLGKPGATLPEGVVMPTAPEAPATQPVPVK